MEVNVSKLFSPITIGSIPLKHRLVLPPLTRLRSNPDDSVSDMMVEHYAQRASDGGLIIIESANISIQARGYIGAPGLYLDSPYRWLSRDRGCGPCKRRTGRRADRTLRTHLTYRHHGRPAARRTICDPL
ncbi:hypothetical protein [Cupriavidus sp. CuC1]|uniref:oxidoreductase n=1 Tax=Cupriavidus sp. CuC1 TaxID=3373131 RepID=UPI0037D8838F